LAGGGRWPFVRRIIGENAEQKSGNGYGGEICAPFF